jgi:hypothetical protein
MIIKKLPRYNIIAFASSTDQDGDCHTSETIVGRNLSYAAALNKVNKKNSKSISNGGVVITYLVRVAMNKKANSA